MTPQQCRMARAGLGWGAAELAKRSGVSYPTLNRFEKGGVVSNDSLRAIETALKDAGAQFTQRSGRVTASVPE